MANAGLLLLPATLGQRLGIGAIVDQLVNLATASVTTALAVRRSRGIPPGMRSSAGGHWLAEGAGVAWDLSVSGCG